MARNEYRWGALFFAVLSVAWTWYSGKDLNWDFLNYHLYGPYSLLEHRLGSDYFAGSFQAYLNPMGYIPLYLMVVGDWHPLLIGAALALLHSIAFALLWLITLRILPESTPRRGLACFVAVFLSFLSPLQLAILGSSFLDSIVALPAIAALYLLVKHAQSFRGRHIAFVGMALGAAAGLKLTNLLLLPAAVLAIESISEISLRSFLRRMALFSVAAVAGFLLTNGYWSYELWKEMGNPVFPLFNNIFQSPDFPFVAYQDRRFLNGNATSVFTLPFALLDHRSWIYSENVVADVRPLVLGIALCLLLGYRVWSKRRDPLNADNDSSRPAFRALLVFAIAFYVIWAEASRIGRYAHVLWLLVGPLLIGVLYRIPWRRAALGGAICTVLVQLLFLHSNGNPRWAPTEWGDKWISVAIPKPLRDVPYAYLTMGTLSNSVLIPFFNKDARFMNLIGQHMQPAADRMTLRARRFLDSDLGLKVMFTAKIEGQISESAVKDVNAILSIYGLRLGQGPCEFVNMEWASLEGFSRLSSTPGAKQKQILAVCSVDKETPERVKIVQEQLAEIDRVFNRVEAVCGDLLNPKGTQTMHGGGGWMRTYFNSNNRLMTDGSTVSIRQKSVFDDIYLGNIADWQSADRTPSCTRQAALDPKGRPSQADASGP
ncbi:MAG: hypothetical protein JSS14_16940 [Proteobacteria bacterium]|nr:hypothetical protein [Pseudomonadota bacterium]